MKKLEEHEMVERVFYSDHPPRAEYKLSKKGTAFMPVRVALREYGDQCEPGKADLPEA